MKLWMIFSFVLSVAIANGETTNTTATGAAPSSVTNTLAAERPLTIESAPDLTPKLALEPKPNEATVGGKTVVSGIAVEAVKTRSFLKLINPFSPPANSSPEDNVVRDISSGKITGLKLLAFHFGRSSDSTTAAH